MVLKNRPNSWANIYWSLSGFHHNEVLGKSCARLHFPSASSYSSNKISLDSKYKKINNSKYVDGDTELQ